jgi:hypothetical protein
VSELWPWGSFAKERGEGVVVRRLAGFVVWIFCTFRHLSPGVWGQRFSIETN